MPREHKTRGRREEKKRKREEAAVEEGSPKRQRHEEQPESERQDFLVSGEAGDDFISFAAKPEEDEDVFYGLLSEEEQSYYGNVNRELEANAFESDSERAVFVEAVHRESDGKELKIASSQSCSRYLEKIILLSDLHQVKNLFAKFSGHFTRLVQHRFASHCCEALFRRATSMIAIDAADMQRSGHAELSASIEQSFLDVVEELRPNIGFLLTEKFASHTIRVLILVLGGASLDDAAAASVLASKKKEMIKLESASQEGQQSAMKVPKSFRGALDNLIFTATSTLNSTYIRALATHPVGNPVLQLLVRLELTQTKSKDGGLENSIYRRLITDENLGAEAEDAKFLHGLVYDPTGSRLVETIIRYAPGKVFKKLNKNFFRPRMATLARNDIASYVVMRLLERMSKEDLEEAMKSILEELPALMRRQRFALLTVLVERSKIRGAKLKPLAEGVQEIFGNDSAQYVPTFLEVKADVEGGDAMPDQEPKNTETIKQGAATNLHGSLLAQAMLRADSVCDLIYSGLLSTDNEAIYAYAKNPIASRILQVALSSSTSTLVFRRQFVPVFYAQISELATDAAGSHVIDALWAGTDGLYHMKEQIASQMRDNESILRESRYGRTVWRNWSMDMHKTKYFDWKTLAKGGQEEHSEDKKPQLSRIELARRKFAEKKKENIASGTNGVAVAAPS